MDYLPAFLDLRGRKALVVGAGAAAAAKARLLAAAGAWVASVGPEPGPELAVLAAGGAVRLLPRPFATEDLRGQALVVATSGDVETDRAVAAAAHAAGTPVNVVDRPELSSFIFPAIVDRGPVVAAVATGGGAPVLARRLRARIERALPANVGALVRFAREFRPAVKAIVPDMRARRALWEEVFDGPIGTAVLAGDWPGAREAMIRRLNRRGGIPQGRVVVIGGGAGDPELITLKAVRAIEDADVIVHDDLADARIFGWARREVIRISLDRRHARVRVAALLADHVREGRRVVRLMAGDVAAGQSHAEVTLVAERGIAVEIVPGVAGIAAVARATG